MGLGEAEDEQICDQGTKPREKENQTKKLNPTKQTKKTLHKMLLETKLKQIKKSHKGRKPNPINNEKITN